MAELTEKLNSVQVRASVLLLLFVVCWQWQLSNLALQPQQLKARRMRYECTAL